MKPSTLIASTLFAVTLAHAEVSYYTDIRPIFQANCHGCHQPAKAKGDYVMTDFAALMKGGESGDSAVSPGEAAKSHLFQQIIPDPKSGEVEMPPKDDPLDEKDVGIIRQWIAEGAKDDTPAGAEQEYDMEHPPVYQSPPVVTSLDFSPDGQLLAVAGYHEVLLHRADGSGIAARLVGLSERIESVRFSPDGKFLAVTGGNPARMGELQVWDVEKRELKLSLPVTYDTIYGASWSPDSQHIAFGCSDSTVRAVEADSGKQILFMGSHNDWALDTVWSVKGEHLVSVGRDMTAKLTEVATDRFVDNITSITPGALKGGIGTVARHPEREEILVGGSDGAPKIYRMFRQVARKIGDDSNLIRKYPVMHGRVTDVAYSPDGKKLIAGSGLDGKGQITISAAEFDPALPKEIIDIFNKTIDQRSADEKKKTEDWWTKDATVLHSIDMPDAAIYAVAWSPDGTRAAASGSDGTVRLIDPESGQIVNQFSAAP